MELNDKILNVALSVALLQRQKQKKREHSPTSSFSSLNFTFSSQTVHSKNSSENNFEKKRKREIVNKEKCSRYDELNMKAKIALNNFFSLCNTLCCPKSVLQLKNEDIEDGFLQISICLEEDQRLEKHIPPLISELLALFYSSNVQTSELLLNALKLGFARAIERNIGFQVFLVLFVVCIIDDASSAIANYESKAKAGIIYSLNLLKEVLIRIDDISEVELHLLKFYEKICFLSEKTKETRLIEGQLARILCLALEL
eukprot:snap_masked-scaffold_11-processed-gene-5.16-mRNA-1 protein AED:1.00 eAED:1.00 QI:0/0/0/0/1/1/2/0/256